MATEQNSQGSDFPVDPLHQFEIQTIVPIPVGGVSLDFTNSSLWMLITVSVITLFFAFATRGRALIPGRLQSCAEIMYEVVANMVRENVGSEGRKYFPLIFTLFMFLLFGNLLGLLPKSFTFTSHIVVTFALAFTIFIAVTVIGVVRHGAHFLRPDSSSLNNLSIQHRGRLTSRFSGVQP